MCGDILTEDRPSLTRSLESCAQSDGVLFALVKDLAICMHILTHRHCFSVHIRVVCMGFLPFNGMFLNIPCFECGQCLFRNEIVHYVQWPFCVTCGGLPSWRIM